MSYKLMIKTHNKTGLKYLCITKKDNWEKYPGSGTYWVRHLNKHGYDFSTELLFESDDYPEFVLQCEYYSIYYNVVLSKEFANLKPELGYDDFTGFWQNASEEVKKEIYARRGASIRRWWQNINEEVKKEIGEKISRTQKSLWGSKSLEERRELTKNFREGYKKWMEEKGENYEKWLERKSIGLKKFYSSMTANEKEEWGKKMSAARLSLPQEKKVERKKKILKWHEDHIDERRKYYRRLSEERRGVNNPAAKKILWEYKISLLSDVSSKYGYELVDKKLREGKEGFRYLYDPDFKKEYEVLVCPYCKLKSDPFKKPSSFKRWHFEHCKMKGISDENCEN